MSLRPSLLAAALGLSAALPLSARADLDVPLASGRQKAPAADRRPIPIPPELRTPRGEVTSFSLGPTPAAIVRRSSKRALPVLPPVDGTVVPVAAPPKPEVEVQAWLGKMSTLTDVFRLPNPAAPWVARFKPETQVAIVSQWQGWFAIVMADGSQAYVPQSHVQVQPYQVKTVIAEPAKPAPPAPSAAPSSPVPTSAAEVVLPASWSANLPMVALGVIREAFRYQGSPYVYGGNSESGIDCSGLVRNCFASQGVQLPRRASEQARVGEEVALDQLQPGDRLYFSVRAACDHTGIYLGDGYFIHAARSRGKVAVDHLTTKLYARSLSCARR